MLCIENEQDLESCKVEQLSISVDSVCNSADGRSVRLAHGHAFSNGKVRERASRFT